MGTKVYIGTNQTSSPIPASDLYSIGTATVVPDSGVHAISYTNIPKEPDFFVIYVDTFNIEQWHRAGIIFYDGEKIYGQSYYTDTDCNFYENEKNPSGTDYRWTYSYSGTTLTISTYGTEQGGYFHNPGVYTIWYAYKNNDSGTVAIAKTTTTSSNNSNTLTFNSLLGRPVFFNSMMRSTLDAQSSPANTITFVNEKGYSTMTNASSSVYAYSAVSNFYSCDDDSLTISAGSNVFGNSEYSLIYAYEASSALEPSSITEVSDFQIHIMKEEIYETLKGQGLINENHMYIVDSEDINPNDYIKKSGDTMAGMLVAQSNTKYTTKQVRNIILVADGEEIPAGQNGDICLVYEA